MPTPRICIDRPLARVELQLRAEELALRTNPRNASAGDQEGSMTKLALASRRCWAPGQTLRIRFLEGEARLHDRVALAASEWTRYANLRFEFLPSGSKSATPAEIRVAFGGNGDSSSWSRLGTESLVASPDGPTINLGWLTSESSDEEVISVVLHEFGHALGCIHEHQSPASAIPWNKPVVYAAYQEAPNYWDKDTVDFNLFERYAASITQFSAFDPESIMLYPIPKEHTDGTFEVGWNNRLSPTDKSFIGCIYPR